MVAKVPKLRRVRVGKRWRQQNADWVELVDVAAITRKRLLKERREAKRKKTVADGETAKLVAIMDSCTKDLQELNGILQNKCDQLFGPHYGQSCERCGYKGED